jgi:uncharacterized damage-inducible protein DinB
MPAGELNLFFELWEREAERTLQLFRALPSDQYDLRPDPAGRSLGELAWHLAEVDGYMSLVIEQGGYRKDLRPPNIERPRTVAGLAPGYERVHAEAVARLQSLAPNELRRTIRVFVEPMPIRAILWDLIISHAAHHRGQLSLMSRIAGVRIPALYGPTREEMDAFRATL